MFPLPFPLVISPLCLIPTLEAVALTELGTAVGYELEDQSKHAGKIVFAM